MTGCVWQIIHMGPVGFPRNNYIPIHRLYYETGFFMNFHSIRTGEEVEYLVEVVGVNIEEVLSILLLSGNLYPETFKTILYKYNANVNAILSGGSIWFWLFDIGVSEQTIDVFINHPDIDINQRDSKGVYPLRYFVKYENMFKAACKVSNLQALKSTLNHCKHTKSTSKHIINTLRRRIKNEGRSLSNHGNGKLLFSDSFCFGPTKIS